MRKYAQPTMSPRTEMFAQGAPSGDEATKLFEDGFSQMAYNVMISKFPDLMQDIVTFKILETDLDSGAGAGAFVVQHDNEVLYVPVIMADNQIKPLDIFYHKALNVFLPLNSEWLNEISQLTLDETGESVQQPKSLRRNVDIRNQMVPPMTGRYAYAAARNEPLTDTVIDQDIYRMLEALQTQKSASAPNANNKTLVTFLTNAPEQVKEAFQKTLTKRPKLAAKVTLLYGLDNITNALAPTKTASATSHKGGALYVADKDTPSSDFKEIFGDKAPEAYQGVLLKGYKAKDNRKKLDSAVQIQGEERLTLPSETGFYNVFTTDGEKLKAFVLHNPRSLETHFEDPALRRNTLGFGKHNKTFIVITEGGKWWDTTTPFVAEPIDRVGDSPSVIQRGTQPRVGNRGLFLVQHGKTYIGTKPFRVEKITNTDGVKRITANWDITIIQDPKASKLGLHQPKGQSIVYVPTTAIFVKLSDNREASSSLLKTALNVKKWFHDKFESIGAKKVSVKNAGANQYALNGHGPLYTFVEATKQAALQFNIHFDEAETLVKQAAAHPYGGATAFVLSDVMMQKMAQVPMMGDPAAMGGAPGGAPGGMPPGGMPQQAPPPPAPPSPLDIAMGEAQTQIQQQMSDLQSQAMALQDKAQTLQMVQQRAQEMAIGGQAAVQQGAPPMPPMGGAPMPPMGGAPMGGAPMGGGAPAGGAPAGRPMPPMGGTPGGGMPAPAPEQIGATMATESPSSMEIQQQINPQFLEQAADLQDTGAFDAAAIASMSQSPSFRDVVVDYVPTLERALDNLGRVLLTMWMQESELKERFGDEEYSDLEDNTRAVFEGLGRLVLQMNRNAIVMEQNPTGVA